MGSGKLRHRREPHAGEGISLAYNRRMRFEPQAMASRPYGNQLAPPVERAHHTRWTLCIGDESNSPLFHQVPVPNPDRLKVRHIRLPAFPQLGALKKIIGSLTLIP
jgi:hypothetical protein